MVIYIFFLKEIFFFLEFFRFKKKMPEFKIADVWSDNLEEEMEKIRQLVDKYPYIAMVKKK